MFIRKPRPDWLVEDGGEVTHYQEQALKPAALNRSVYSVYRARKEKATDVSL